MGAITLESDRENFQDFYGITANAAEGILNLYGSRYYARRFILKGREATYESFIDTIEYLADTSDSVVDVFLNMHGSQEGLAFSDGWINSKDISARLKEIKHNIRAVYSSACYGAHHAMEYIKGGVVAATGTRGVCTNDAYATPRFLQNWTTGRSFAYSVAATNSTSFRYFFDRFAKWGKFPGHKNADSKRFIYGNGNITICHK